MRVEQARIAERARIAREMHDVLAHRLSLVAMHAGVLAHRTDLGREEMANHAAVIRDNAENAVSELRGVLGVLRGGGTAVTEPPQPTLAHLPTLIGEARLAGTPVEAVGEMPDLDELPSATSRAAYRTIQECLTNARKHATGRPVLLGISGRPGIGLVVELSNPLTGAAPAVRGSGLGLVGLRERVDLLGGALSYGEDDGMFVVRIELPWEAS